MYSFDPAERIHDSPLSLAARDRYVANLGLPPPTDAELRNVAETLKAAFDSSAHVYGALKQYAGAWMGRSGALKLPWMEVPRSCINTTVDGARRFVAQSWPFARIRAVGKAMDATFNDAVLAMCAGALRTYLVQHGELPAMSLKAMVPVSLRRPGDVDSANAVGAISADLATNVADPIQRFRAIQASTEAGKKMLMDLSPAEATMFLQLIQLPGLALMPLGLMDRFPPYSTTISNVPGPRQPMFWNGARLEGVYPASIVAEGMALNITLVTYYDQVDFGITACRRSLPQVQRFIDYLEESLTELEDAVGISSQPKRKRASRSGSGRKRKPQSKSGVAKEKKAKAESRKRQKQRPKPGQQRKPGPVPKRGPGLELRYDLKHLARQCRNPNPNPNPSKRLIRTPSLLFVVGSPRVFLRRRFSVFRTTALST